MRTVRARRGCPARAAPPAAKAAAAPAHTSESDLSMPTMVIVNSDVFVERDCLNKLKRSGLWTSTSKSWTCTSTSKSTPKTRGRPRARVLPM